MPEIKLWIPERQVVNPYGNLVTQWGEYIPAATLQEAELLCPDGWSIDGYLCSEQEWGKFDGD